MISWEGKNLILLSTVADSSRDAGLKIPEEINYIDKIQYGEDTEFQNLDICYPKDTNAKLPVIVSVHGGGYVYGSTRVYMFYCADLARRGFIVVNFNYRLAPKHKFPAPLEDLDSVLHFITENEQMKQYPFDFDNVFIVGDSAGAQIASQYAAIFTNDEYRALFGFEKPAIKLKGLGLNCGARFDMYNDCKKSPRYGVIRDYFGLRPTKFGDKINVFKYIDSNYPPTYFITAKGDDLTPFSEPMKNLLESKNVKAIWKIYGDENVWHVFHVNVRWDIGIEANDDETNFFKELID